MRQESQSFASGINQSAQREADDNRILYTDNYGGLNTEASAINIPLADSPEMLNMEIGITGRIKKRGGSVLRNVNTGYSDGYIVVPVQMKTGEWLVWEKVGQSMIGTLLPSKTSNNSGTTIWTFDNLFSSGSTNEKPSFVVTKEEYPRLIMVQSNTVPVEIEFTMIEVVGDGNTTIDIPGDWTSLFGTTYSYGIYGTTSNQLTGISHSSGTTTLTFTSSITAGQRLTLVQPIFHWWAEAVKRTQDQIYATAVRFNTSLEADANVEVPVEIRRGLFADYLAAGLSSGQMPCLLLTEHSTAAGLFTFDKTPTAATEYAWSALEYLRSTNDAVAGSPSAGDYVSLGTNFVTFGDISGTGTSAPTPIRFIRLNYLPFNGGTFAQAGDVDVITAAGTTLTWRTNIASKTTTWGSYWLSTANFALTGTSSDLTPYVRFDASVPFGIEDSEFVEIVNADENNTWVGTAATETPYAVTSFGSYRPIYGLPEFCNYQTGIFPTIIALYQNRIVLSGVSAFPNYLFLSNQGNQGSRFNYQNFQIYMEDSTVATNPVEVQINGIGSITGVIDWFNSLFVFTEDAVKRVYANNQILTPTDKTQSDIATIGCKSVHAITKTDRNVVFIANSGLHKVAVLEQTGDYYVESVALKVRDIFQKASNYGRTSWVSYEPNGSVVYVGISDGYDPYINQRLLVYYNERESWSEFGLFTGYLPNAYGACFDGRVVVNVVDRVAVTVPSQPDSTTLNYLAEFERSDLVVDLVQALDLPTFNAGTEVVLGSRTATVTFTVNADQRVIQLSKDKVPVASSNYGFKYIPLEGFYPFTVTYTQGGIDTTQTGGEDYINEPVRNALHSTAYPWNTSDTLKVQLRDEDGLSPIWISIDNEELVEGTDFTVTESGNTYLVDSISTATGTTTLMGFKFPAWHFTPTFFRQSHRAEKRVTHYLGYYSNRDFVDVYQASDGDVADQYKVRANVNVAIIYNDTRTGSISTDLYFGSDLIWDVSLFDVAHSPFQLYDVTRIVQPIIGIGFSFAVANFSFSSKSFELVGYTVETLMKGKNSRAWF